MVAPYVVENEVSFERMPSMLNVKTMLTAALCALPGLSTAATLDFEEFTSFQQLGTAFTTQGFRFTATSGDMLAYPAGVVPTVPESGSTSVGMSNQPSKPAPVNSSLTVTSVTGDRFNLNSFRAAKGCNAGQFFAAFASTSLDILGHRADGSTVSLSFVFDGIANDNPASDFETVSFSGFTNLTSFSVTGQGGARGGYSFLLDDVNVTLAPVPLSAGRPAADGRRVRRLGGPAPAAQAACLSHRPVNSH